MIGRRLDALLRRAAARSAPDDGQVPPRTAALQAALDHVDQGVAVFDREARLLIWNQRHMELHGHPRQLYRVGTPLRAFDEHDPDSPGGALGSRAEPSPSAGAVRRRRAGADGRILEEQRRPLPDGGLLCLATDLDERRDGAVATSTVPQHDALTGLPDRLLLGDRLAQAIARCRRDADVLAVMRVEVDGLEEVGDPAEARRRDLLIQRVAERLRTSLRDSDTVARIGVGSFALILPSLPAAEAVGPIAGKILARLAEPFDLDDRGGGLRARIGIASFPGDGDSGEALLACAEQALADARSAGGDPVTAALARDGERRRGLEGDLARALGRAELSLDYQPQLDLRSDRVVGLEALLRWHHPELGAVSPETTIAVAETSGQIGPIGEWALAEACAAAIAWPSPASRPLQIAVNLSATQLARWDLVHRVARILQQSGLPPERLVFELTETTVLADLARATGVLEELKAMGIGLALDDFGTGYASLSHLKSFPLDAIKIDRSFIADLETDPDAAIVRSLIELGHRLGLRVVAEGVETATQLAALRRLECDAAQGHQVGRPLAGGAVEPWLRAEAGAAVRPGAPRDPAGRGRA